MTKTALGVLFALILLSGCATTTRNNTFNSVDTLIKQNQYEPAVRILEANEKKTYYSDKDLVLAHMDTGMLSLMGNQTAKGISHLEKAEALMEEYYTKSLTSAAQSLLLNDTMLEYSGEPYEDMYTNVFKALAYAKLRKNDDAFVEVKRVGVKLDLLEDKYSKLASGMSSSKDAKTGVSAGKTEFHNSALAHYISFLLYRSDKAYDDAQIDLDQIGKAFTQQPSVYAFNQPDFSASMKDLNTPRLSVVSFAGWAPLKRASTLIIATQTNLLSIVKQNEDSSGRHQTEAAILLPFPGIESGYRFKCQTPYLVNQGTPVASVSVLVDGKEAGKMVLLESLENVANATFKVHEPMIFTKTIIRTTIKGIVAQKAKKAVNEGTQNQGLAGALLGAALGVAADVAVDASEIADVRTARFLPAKAFVGDFPVAAGDHKVVLNYLDASGKVIAVTDLGVQSVQAKGLNLVTDYVH